MGRVLIINPGTDIAGGGYALKRAFDLHPNGWTARQVRTRDSVYDYPCDIQWNPRDRATGKLVRDLFNEADVIHVWEDAEIVAQFAGWQNKTIIVQHMGSRFRKYPDEYSARARQFGAFEAIGSHELFRIAKRGDLALICGPVEELAPLREKLYQPSNRVRIVHSSTNRDSKATNQFIAATDRLKARYPIDVDVIEGATWGQCLAREALADIFFAEVRYGYGSSSIECWSMGIPVVAGVKFPEAREAMLRDFGTIPYVEATEDTIEQALEPLIVDRSLREQWGAIGRAFVEAHYSESVVTQRMAALYDRLVRS